MYTRVKICGLTTEKDIVLASELGYDSIGLNFFPESKRFVTLEKAIQLAREVPPFITLTGIFVNADSDYIKKILDFVPLNVLQFHGSETAAQCEAFDRPYIKTCLVKPGCDIVNYCQTYSNAKGILLDTYHPTIIGGTGKTFDWQIISVSVPKPIILAGGLTVENVKSAVLQVQPYAVDVCSGVESKPGIKDVEKMWAFIKQVRNNETT